IDLASIGLGIAFIPDYCIPRKSKQLFIVETKETLPERELVIAYNEHVPISKNALEFMNYFEEL
ncbi:MAG: LysR family transcriptional regulator, partial [Lachnospiraceae bacterium]